MKYEKIELTKTETAEVELSISASRVVEELKLLVMDRDDIERERIKRFAQSIGVTVCAHPKFTWPKS